ncbi:DUF4058 family protein [Armatimonas sp.]|uniref:DUF4058 family protein n=1 Tax=Armatimonas sp. TaxID=1872638 RepID=UPI0037515F5B
MPSPFPGMDPYLENQNLWPAFHNAFIYCLNAAINRQLPAGFASRLEERLVVEEGIRHFVADVSVGQNGPPSGGMAVAESPSKMEMEWAIEESEPFRETFIEIQTRAGSQRRVVAVVELLSHSNKSTGRGRDEYLSKQKTLLESEVHLLEIDLLRAGEHTLAASRSGIQARFGPFDYAVSLHRGGYGSRFQAIGWTLQEVLPTVLVPLDEHHPDLEVDLRPVFERTYDECGFARMVDYSKVPEPVLPGALAA